MLYYVLIVLCLSLTGVAGFQLFYMAYLDRLGREHKKKIAELEYRCSRLIELLKKAETRIIEQNEILSNYEPVDHSRDELWADVIEDS